MNITPLEIDVLGRCSNDIEAPHTIAADMARGLKRPVTESEVRDAFLSLASKGLVTAYVFDAISSQYRPISLDEASRTSDAWYEMSRDGRDWYKRETAK